MQKLPKSLMGGGVPTANIGGTGMCITNQSKNVDLAWDLIRIQNMTTEGILHGYKLRTTYPTYKPAYQSPLLKQPSTYFGGVKVGELYASLAPDVQAFVPPLIWPQASQALISNAITPVMQNKTDARAALTALAARSRLCTVANEGRPSDDVYSTQKCGSNAIRSRPLGCLTLDGDGTLHKKL
jgi:ABC-type glycerol-3-phosphate transport system substrate-binding protein